MLNANWPVRTETPRAHLGTATVAQTGPDASGCRGLAIHPPAEYHSAKSRCIAMHRDQSALQASLDPYRWQCQDAPKRHAKKSFFLDFGVWIVELTRGHD